MSETVWISRHLLSASTISMLLDTFETSNISWEILPTISLTLQLIPGNSMVEEMEQKQLVFVSEHQMPS